MNSRVLGTIVSVVLIAATLEPVLRDPNDDGFPLSTYPMFAWKRSTRVTMDYLVGYTAGGERWHVPPRLIGSSEVMQAKRLVDRAVAGGRAGMMALCERAAERVKRRRPDIVSIAVVNGTHEAVDYLARDVRGTERERVRCQVPR